ncbi:MAG: hypothetical protein RDU20_23085 [Desulfomonilaceae bacterium]|nr:hypothetical protein [Desulfomonilaceae bacterium]
MCTDGVSMLIFDNEAIMEKMSNPILDFVHKQVVMTLYSLHASNRLDAFRELLPTYLSKDRSECEAILRTLEQAGLLTLSSDGIALTHPVEPQGKG